VSRIKINEDCINCLRELGAPTKVRIISALADSEKPKSVNEFVKLLGLRQPTVSFHLKTLKEVGLLRSEKKGRFVFYSLDKACEKGGKRCFLY